MSDQMPFWSGPVGALQVSVRSTGQGNVCAWGVRAARRRRLGRSCQTWRMSGTAGVTDGCATRAPVLAALVPSEAWVHMAGSATDFLAQRVGIRWWIWNSSSSYIFCLLFIVFWFYWFFNMFIGVPFCSCHYDGFCFLGIFWLSYVLLWFCSFLFWLRFVIWITVMILMMMVFDLDHVILFLHFLKWGFLPACQARAVRFFARHCNHVWSTNAEAGGMLSRTRRMHCVEHCKTFQRTLSSTRPQPTP